MKKDLRKYLVVLLIAVLSITLTACGGDSSSENTEMGTNEIADLYNKGLVCNMTSADENTWKGVFQPEEGYDEMYLVEAKMTSEIYEEYNSIEFDDEKDDEKKQAIITSLEGVKITDISDKVPTQEEMNKYVGKTIGDLEDDEFENSGNTNDEGVYTFFYDGPVYCVQIGLEKGVKIKDIDDYSANDLRKLKIGSIEFMSMSSRILD